MGSSIQLVGVSKAYKNKEVVKSIYLDVEDGEFLTILGPSGAGKTTVLKMIAGFEKTTDGFIKIDNKDITHLPTHKRNIGMLFQNYALFPHLTVEQNIAFPLTIKKIDKTEIKKRIDAILERVKLIGYEKRLPRELSGGQQQRVALARALVFNPPILLLDEPMAALDKQLKKHMQLEIKQIQREIGITTISVTHDQEEALTMATKVCVMKDGEIAQVATPNEIYEKPNSNFVAKFIGEANLIKGKIIETKSKTATVKLFGDSMFTISKNSKFIVSGNNVNVLIRPEKINVVDDDSIKPNTIDVIVQQVVYVGEALKLTVKTQTDEILKIKMFTTSKKSISVGDKLKIELDENYMNVIKDW